MNGWMDGCMWAGMFVYIPFMYAVNNNRVSSEKCALRGGLHKLLHLSDTYYDIYFMPCHAIHIHKYMLVHFKYFGAHIDMYSMRR